MRKIFYLFAFISAGLFLYSVYRFSQQYTQPALPHIHELKGFQAGGEGDDYAKLLLAFRQKISESTQQAEEDQNWYFWLSFIVTTLTAGSTLVSSVQAARKDSTDNPSRAQTFAIVMAILTFCTTLANFASSHFNDLKTEETKKVADLTSMRNQFYADYDKATQAEKPAIIKTYEHRLE